MAMVFTSFFFFLIKPATPPNPGKKAQKLERIATGNVRWYSQHSENKHTDDLKTQRPHSCPFIPERRTRVHTKLGHNTCSHKAWTQMYTEGLLIRAPKPETSKVFLSFRTVNKLWQQVHGKLLLPRSRVSRVRPSATP